MRVLILRGKCGGHNLKVSHVITFVSAKFEVLTRVLIQVVVFCDRRPCRLVNSYEGGTIRRILLCSSLETKSRGNCSWL